MTIFFIDFVPSGKYNVIVAFPDGTRIFVNHSKSIPEGTYLCGILLCEYSDSQFNIDKIRIL